MGGIWNLHPNKNSVTFRLGIPQGKRKKFGARQKLAKLHQRPKITSKPSPPHEIPYSTFIMAMTSPDAHQEERQRWYDLENEMNDFLLRGDGTCDEMARKTSASASILTDLHAAASATLHASSRAISRTLSESIRREEGALQSESSALADVISSVRDLECEIDTLSISISDAMSRRRRLIEIDIPQHESSMFEYKSDIDGVRSRHVRDNAKIARELSFHALLTNIRWTYGHAGGGGDGGGGGGGRDALAGEVSIPERAVHRRFVIDRGEEDENGGCISEYDIAERLWETIGG
jgi:hypothetical protein